VSKRARLLVPVAIVAVAATLGIFVLGSGAGASPQGSPAVLAAISASAAASATSATSAPTASQLAAGQVLFAQNCSNCHGATALGSNRAPSLQGVGGATVDLWLTAGWMPLAEPTSQPEDKPVRFTSQQISQIVAYVTSLAPGGVPIPSVDLTNTDLATGFDLFALNCAGCHTITGAGDELAGSVRAPSLHGVAPTQVAEAILTGPGNMPRFTSAQISPSQLNDLVGYVVQVLQHPTNPGGLSLGGVGPVAEGFVGLFVGVGACMLVAFWIGDRTERDEEEHHGHSAGHGAEEAHA
jgi:ubiquinol-cytochrome c reductase cytochrome c subunit